MLDSRMNESRLCPYCERRYLHLDEFPSIVQDYVCNKIGPRTEGSEFSTGWNRALDAVYRLAGEYKRKIDIAQGGRG